MLVLGCCGARCAPGVVSRVFGIGMMLAVISHSEVAVAGPFSPPAGEAGSIAVSKDDPGILGWATGAAELVRGPQDIAVVGSTGASFGSVENVLGAASGVATDVLSLGDGGFITLTFDHVIRNGVGADFAVFENSFADTFLELAFVEVSSNGLDFFRFDAISLTPTDSQVGSFGQLDPTDLHNLAGSFRAGFGTPFDLEEMSGVAAADERLDLSAIRFVRIVDAVGTIDPAFASFDSLGNLVNDPYPTAFASGGFDLDGVAVLNGFAVPNAVPAPPAIWAGLVLLGFVAGRRRDRSDRAGRLVGDSITRRERRKHMNASRSAASLVAACFVFVACMFVSIGANAAPVTLVNEQFGDDPVVNGRATVSGDASRFIAGSGSLTAGFDTSLPTSKLVFDLGATLNQTTSFSFEADLVIGSAGFFADPNGFAQLSFGLFNSVTTGDNRTGGPDFSTEGDTFDVVTVDYFPNITAFGGPSFGPTAVGSDGGSGFFSEVVFPFGQETDLTAEGALPLDVLLTMRVSYDSMTRELLLAVSSAAAAIDINSDGAGGVSGGADGDIATIQSVLPESVVFSLDSFGLLLWEDHFRLGPNLPSVTADVRFDRLLVTADIEGVAVPEPASLVLLTAGVVCGLGRRHRYRRAGGKGGA